MRTKRDKELRMLSENLDVAIDTMEGMVDLLRTMVAADEQYETMLTMLMARVTQLEFANDVVSNRASDKP